MVRASSYEDSVEVGIKAGGGGNCEFGTSNAVGVKETLVVSLSRRLGACDPFDARACNSAKVGVIINGIDCRSSSRRDNSGSEVGLKDNDRRSAVEQNQAEEDEERSHFIY